MTLSRSGSAPERKRPPGGRQGSGAPAAPVASSAALSASQGACACGGGCPRCDATPAWADDPGDEQAADGAALQALWGGGVPTGGRGSRTAPPGSLPRDDERANALIDEHGRPIAEPDRGVLERQFGTDLGAIRIHRGARADALVRQAGAVAFATGRHVVLGRVGPREESLPARALLAHEVSHILRGTTTAPDRVVVRRSLDDYLAAVHHRPEPDWQAAAEQLDGERIATIREMVRLLDPARRVHLHEGALRASGRCSHVARETEADYRRARPEASATSDADCSTRGAEVGLGLGTTAGGEVAAGPDADALGSALRRLRLVLGPLTVEGAITGTREALEGIDLTDAGNLRAVTDAIGAQFPGDLGGRVLAAILGDAERARRRAAPASRGPTDAQRAAAFDQTISLLQPQRRGPYGQVGPGILFPVLAQPARHLVPLFEAIGVFLEPAANALDGAGAFVVGLLQGLSGSMDESEREQLANRLLQSSVLNVVFPAVFAAGAVVGVVEDVVDAVKGIYHVITNFSEVIDGFRQLFRLMTSPEAANIGARVGAEMGRSYGRELAALAAGNIVEFTFGLGRMIGPTIIYTVLGFLGVPEMVAAAIVSRLMEVLGPMLERFPRLLALLERLAARMGRGAAHANADALEADIEQSFARTFDQPGHDLPHGGPTTHPPEVTRGVLAQHLAGLRRLFGRVFTDGEVSRLGVLWDEVANAGESASLNLQNSRRLFNNQRGRFWRRVRGDAAARQLFTDAGCVFGENATSAPFYELADGSRIEITIDHIIERQTAPGQALSPSNLRLSTRRENTVVLRQLTDQDVFQR